MRMNLESIILPQPSTFMQEMVNMNTLKKNLKVQMQPMWTLKTRFYLKLKLLIVKSLTSIQLFFFWFLKLFEHIVK